MAIILNNGSNPDAIYFDSADLDMVVCDDVTVWAKQATDGYTPGRWRDSSHTGFEVTGPCFPRFRGGGSYYFKAPTLGFYHRDFPTSTAEQYFYIEKSYGGDADSPLWSNSFGHREAELECSIDYGAGYDWIFDYPTRSCFIRYDMTDGVLTVSFGVDSDTLTLLYAGEGRLVVSGDALASLLSDMNYLECFHL